MNERLLAAAMPLLYNGALLLASPVLALYLAYRLVLKGKSREGFLQRLGWAPSLPPPSHAGRVWLHAVSAGEMVAAAAVARHLLEADPTPEVVVSATTPAGRLQAERLVPAARAHFYFPFDFLPCALLALLRVRPTVVAAVETEIWPNWLWLARKLGIRRALVNGQFSDRGFGRARRARPLYAWALAQLDALRVQSGLARERAIALGAPADRTAVTGSVKFDQEVSAPRREVTAAAAAAFGDSPAPPLLVAGSTHPGEEELVLAAFRAAREDRPDLRLLLAPRHIERWREVAALLDADPDLSYVRRTEPAGPADVLLLDTMGELAGAYGLGRVAFVGGSLVPVGGHDILQPLFHGVPTLFGPHMENQRDLAGLALAAGAARQVEDAQGLARAVVELLEEGPARVRMVEAAEELLRANRGAARSCAELLAGLARGGES